MKTPSDLDRLLDESDRGFVLVLAAMIEMSIEQTLRCVFQQNKMSKNIQDSLFDSNGPLATFSGKLKIAYGFGLIQIADFHDVEFLRKLRNEAAHSKEDFDLSNHPLGKELDQLNCVRPYEGKLKRYSLPKDDNSAALESQPLRDAKLRVAGYLKARKVNLAFGMYDIRARLFTLRTGIPFPPIWQDSNVSNPASKNENPSDRS